MTQEQFYLNKIGRGCYKLPERPRPLEPENNNYLPGCVLRPTHSDYLIQLNMLSEFSTPEQLAEARSNLGITPLLEELNRQLDERVLTTQRAVVEQTLTDNENRVLSSHGLYLILQQYYTKNDLDSLITKINELIANLIIVDNELSNESTNPVLNKVLTDAINGIYEVIVNRIINPRKKDDGMGYNSYISVREELEAKVNLTELENYYNKEQVDIIKQNLQSQIDEAKNISNTVIELVQTAEYLERLKSIVFDDLTELIPTKVSDLENDSQYITSSEVSSEISSAVNTAVSSLVNGAPEALDTLKEIADKLGDNDDAVAGLINQITEETSRAKSTENTLSTALNNEISRAKAAEKANSDNIDTLNTTLNLTEEVVSAALNDLNLRINDTEEVVAAALNDLNTNKVDKTELSPVATTGSYNDLNNKPTKVSLFTNDRLYSTSTEVLDAILTAISNLINGAPEALDTLKEIADALGNDPEVITKLTQRITAAETALNSKKDKLTAFAYTTSGETDRIITGIIQDENGAITITSNVAYNANRQKHGLMSSDHYIKLEGISAGAEVNVQSDWNETNTASDTYIQNKPDLSVYALVSDVEDNELVVASALNDLNSRITEANGNLADAEATAAALTDLNSRINILDETIDALWHGSNYTYTTYSIDDMCKALDDKIMREICSKELAQPGYLVLNATISGVSNDIYMSLDAYEKYGKDGYTVVGIVVKPYNPDTNEVICMSTKYMSLVKPELGSTDPVDMKWGDNTTDTSLTNYGSSNFYLPSDYLNNGVKNNIDKGTYWFTGTATDGQHVSPYISSSVIANVNLAANDPCNDTDGRSNSSVIAGITTATHTSGGTIDNSSAAGNYPANDACRYYNMGGRSWYLPAMGELQFIVPRFKEINASFSKFSKSLTNKTLWSSTEFSLGSAWGLYLLEDPFGYVNFTTKGDTYSVVAFAAF